MSLIQFRGRPILPPLVKTSNPLESSTEKSFKDDEDEKLLTIPPSEALKIILCGLPSISYRKPTLSCNGDSKSDFSSQVDENDDYFVDFKSKYRDEIILSDDKPCNKNEDTFKNHSESVVNSNTNLSEAESCIINKENISNFSKSRKNIIISEPLNIKTESELLSKVCSEDVKNGLNDENDLSSETKISPPLSSATTPPDKNSQMGVTNHQKLKALKSSGTDSSSYLQDYLQLLTSRSHFPKIGKVKKESDALSDSVFERRGSAPLLTKKPTSTNVRQRNSSGSSDKSGSTRSLGSIYLDSYLGNLTDHSWIIYPTEPNAASPSKSTDKSESPVVSSTNTGNGDYLQRKLRFINPEKFFNCSENKNIHLEEPPQSVPQLKSSSSLENEHEFGLTDTSGIVVSPDISCSSLDTDKLDGSHPISTSLQESVNQECKSSQDTLEKKENEESDKFKNKNTSEINAVEEKPAPVSNSDHVTQKLSVKFDNLLSDDSVVAGKLQNNNESKSEAVKFTYGDSSKDISNVSDESTDVSSDEDAEDQVSMIVCDLQKSGDMDVKIDNKESKSAQTSLKEAVSVSTEYSTSTITLSEEKSKPQKNYDSENLTSKLIKMLKAKQEEELNELQKKHENEMKNFIQELSQLSVSQKLALAKAYESPNNNSLNEMLRLSNYVPSSSMQDNVSAENSNVNNAFIKDSYSSASFNHTNLMPSFFLHGSKLESNSIKRPDINKISQIFSPSKGSNHNVTRYLSFNPNLSYINPEKKLNIQSSQLTDCSENDSNLKGPRVFSQRKFEVGLDLVPTRESDGVLVSSMLESLKYHQGISRLQAIVRGKIIRKLMKTPHVQQLLSTLKEVAKLAYQFHQDILMDNIRKGDIDFHKALFNEEQQAREKFIKIMVESTPVEQVRIIKRERAFEEREKERRAAMERLKHHSTANRLPMPKIMSLPHGETAIVEQPVKSLSSPRPDASPHKSSGRTNTKKVYASELPRPCKATLSSEAKTVGRFTSSSPRGRQSHIPSQKSMVSKGIPKHRIVKKIDTLPQTHVPPRRQNTPICKSDGSHFSSAGMRTCKSDRNSPANFRGDAISTRKPWR